MEVAPLSLLTHPWLPVLRRSGRADSIRPAQLAEMDDPVIALDWPRADFRIAGLEFLIGLLTTAYPPRRPNDWLEAWDKPPVPEVLDAAFAPMAHAFNLDGPGPRFMQDFEDLVSEAEPIERLLIETPGASTLGKNTDLLVRRGRVLRLGRPAAAMMLYAFQSWAPAGGAGNRVGLRGGGPLVTLVVPRDRPALWHTLWANVPVCPDGPPTPEDYPRIFPWLAPTLTSEGQHLVTPENAHPLQAWWGMPRRIRLDFAPGETLCDLTGAADGVAVTGWRQRPRGPNYGAWAERHPLTPRYTQKAGAEWLSVHPQPGGIGYRHWLGLVQESPDGLRQPAPTIAIWRAGRAKAAGARGTTRLLAAGYDMDNMKARGFVESEMPLPGAQDDEAREKMDALAKGLVLSADKAAEILRRAIRNALFSAGATVKADAELLSAARERLWAQSEAEFFAHISDAAAGKGQDAPAGWRRRLRDLAVSLFDEAAPLAPELGSAAPRIARARRTLLFALNGYGKDGAEFFTVLGLTAPEAKSTRKRSAA